MNILISGFEAFQDDQINPSQEILKQLPTSIEGHTVFTATLPVLYNESFEILKTHIQHHQPDIVICLGLAAGREGISPERVAINLNDSIHPDNGGVLYEDEIIIEDGNNAYFSTLPIKEMVATLKARNVSAYVSNSAGLYVCNDIMYRLLHYITSNQLEIMGGFIHVPYMSEQPTNNKFSMPLRDLVSAITECIKVCL